MSTVFDLRLLRSSAVRSWLEAPRSAVLESLPVDDGVNWARSRWRATPPDSSDVGELWPDRLHALVRVIRDDSAATESRIRAWYEVIEAIDWPSDLFAEKVDLLCQVGYLAWRQAFRYNEPATAWAWEEKVMALAPKLPSVPEFMSLSETQRTDQVRSRFLSDPVIVLTECRRLTDLTNRNPREALLQARGAYKFLSGVPCPSWSANEHAYFQSNFCLAIAIGEKELGNFRSSAAWLDRAEALNQLAHCSDITRARSTFVRKALAYQLRQWEEALDGTAELKQLFVTLGSPKYKVRCTFVEGVALKELGRDWESLPKLLEVASSTDTGVESWFRGLALIHVAGIYGRNAQDVLAIEALSTAWELIKDTDVVAAIALFHGMKGEILRDRGLLHASIESYRLSVAAYAAGGLSAMEAYVRVLVAEALLVAGEDRHALLEIIKALPVIESVGLVREAVVAIALLRESLARQEANPEALKIIKSELQKVQKGGQSWR